MHLWLFDLDPPAPELATERSVLAPDEIQRADAFVFERHRERYALGRATLRRVLSGYLGVAPRTLSFSYGPAGKPRLTGATGLEFNLAHSRDFGLLAVARGQEVGVDLEVVRPMADAENVAETFFSPTEVAELGRTTPDERALAFFRLWTRKEAVLKALGEGITSDGLRRMEVGCHPLSRPAVAAGPGSVEAARHWMLTDVEVAPAYASALATRHRAEVSRWSWNGTDLHRARVRPPHG